MSSKAIKVSENTYSRLKKLSEEKNKSIKEIVDEITEDRTGLEDYKGSWNLTESELAEIKEEREKIWEEWEL